MALRTPPCCLSSPALPFQVPKPRPLTYRWPGPRPHPLSLGPDPCPSTSLPQARLLAQGPCSLTQAVARLTANAAQTLNQGADGGGAGGCTWAGQPVQQVVGKLHEEAGAAGGRQVAERPNRSLAHGQARATQLRQEAVQEAGMEGSQWGAQPGEPEEVSGGPTRQARHSGPGTAHLPIFSWPPPRNYDNPMALGKQKGALQLYNVIIHYYYYYTKESREQKGLS